MPNTLKQHGFPLTINRLFTQPDRDAFELIHFRQPNTEDEEQRLPMECPDNWSDEAALLLAEEAAFQSVPTRCKSHEENTVPSWLWRRNGYGEPDAAETSVKDIFTRVVGGAAYTGWKQGVFADETAARTFFDEARYALAQRFIAIAPRDLAAMGTNWAYGLKSMTIPSMPSAVPHDIAITNAMIDAIVGGTRDKTVRAKWHKATVLKKETSVDLRFADIAADWGGTTEGPMRAVIDLMSCRHNDGSVNIAALRQATSLLVMVLDLNNTGPALAIGFSNLASLLMALTLPYDSTAAQATAAAISAIITAEATAVSAELAALRGVVPDFNANRETVLRRLRNHRRAAYGDSSDYEKISVLPVSLMLSTCPDLALVAAARDAWDDALQLAQNYGLRHLNVTTLTPSPVLALFTESATQGIEPMCGLTVIQPRDDGLFNSAVHPSVAEAFLRLGYDARQNQTLTHHIIGHRSLAKAPVINHMALRTRGFDAAALERVENYLPNVNSLRLVFTPWIVGEEFCRRVLKMSAKDIQNPRFDMLYHLGFSATDIVAADAWCYGHGNLRDARDMRSKHTPVFAGSNDLPPDARLRMAAAVQGFISGETGLEVTVPFETPVDRVEKILLGAWRQGVKSMSLTCAAETQVQRTLKTVPVLAKGKGEQKVRSSVFVYAKAPVLPSRRPKPGTATIHVTRAKPKNSRRDWTR